jgi:hypothetical protein
MPDLFDAIKAVSSMTVPKEEAFRTLPPRARATDPQTSKAAAARASHAPSHQEAILGVLWRPMTQFEIARLTGLSPEQVHKRLSELSRDNPETGYTAQIRDTGQTKPGPSGRDCILWSKV